jgi:hypothetical protein
MMQQLWDARIRKCPLSGMSTFNPRDCDLVLRMRLWREYCGLAEVINTKDSEALAKYRKEHEELDESLEHHCTQGSKRALDEADTESADRRTRPRA